MKNPRKSALNYCWLDKRQSLVVIALVLLVPMTFLFLYIRNQLVSVDTVIQEFQTSTYSEECLIDPLICGGRRMCPRILEEVKSKEFPRRRYAIAFLGNEKYIPAITYLTNLVNDDREEDYIRGDALLAIEMIDLELAKKTALELLTADCPNYLRVIAEQVINGRSVQHRRSVIRAFFSNTLFNRNPGTFRRSR